MIIPTIAVRKLEAAQRQVNTSIKLWFADADPVSVHTLACAAHQIIHDINTDVDGSDLLFDSAVINDEFRTEFVREMKKAMNFFKHADKDPDPNGIIELSQQITELFILFSVLGLERLGSPHSFDTTAFVLYYGIKNPRLVTKQFSDRIKIEDVAGLQSVSKAEFLKHFQSARRESK